VEVVQPQPRRRLVAYIVVLVMHDHTNIITQYTLTVCNISSCYSSFDYPKLEIYRRVHWLSFGNAHKSYNEQEMGIQEAVFV
jgi:hypothetical protein